MNGASGTDLIAAERRRQIDAEGWTPEHDDGLTEHELALAAACYAVPDNVYVGRVNNRIVKIEDAWPWNAEEFKGDPDVRAWYPGPLAKVLLNRADVRAARIRELTKAGALVAAEIDRLLRAAE
jgi:hypothetical protein